MHLPWWLIVVSVGLGIGVRQLALPWWADFLIGLVGGVALLWACALALCHRAGRVQVLLWEKKYGGEAGVPMGEHHRPAQSSNGQ